MSFEEHFCQQCRFLLKPTPVELVAVDGNPAWTGWSQLGRKTLIDAIADIRNRVLR